MDVLRTYNDTYEWREAARWVKYEEVVEEGGKRWSKPHVASLSMQSLFELRNALADGVILLDFDCHSLPQAVDKILDEWIEKGQLDSKLRAHMRDVSLKYHKHGHVKRNKSKGTKLGDIPDESGRRSSMVALPSTPSFSSFENGNGNPSSPDLLHVPSDSNLSKYKPNTNFMRKIPKDAEVASVMVGEVEDLDKRLVAIEFRKTPSTHSFGNGGGAGGDGASFGEEDDHGGHGDDPALEMSKIPFLGLIRDIKRKVPFYLSDFKDAIHIQCLASFIYVFLGTMTPNVTFGGLLGEATDQYMGGFYDCGPKKYVGDVFFFSILLFLGTFSIAIALIDFKRTTVFPSMIRQRLSDFGVLIAILCMVGLDAVVGLDTPKLTVPTEFKPTRPGRGWFVNPFSDKNPWWLYLAASVPALLCTILVFLDQQITAVIVNRKENKLKKGVGYHLDMFVVAICVGIHSFLGLPWYVAATVSALAHINSLKKESECTAPGEKPTYLGYIPMPVLYGVFFFMGFQALRGMQLVDRLFLFIQPVKYQPDFPYIRHVPLLRIHLFTFIQVLCLGILWAVKTIKAISIGFPLMVLATGVVRKMLECVYTQNELKWIDDLLPGKSANEKKEKSAVPYKTFNGNINNAYLNGSKDDVMSKPKFFVSEECEISERKNGQGNTKL
ncbi:hypothetical protein KUTeg_008198 [Tegillarca granosa]|uniref:Anion exchange protein n=1 Tax=Tegillarca granosa TaxID=220873 RepID=A0ABQ9FB81_TEGGR|nr:hypothetical protein KUTeg_008198 [Tegillarca granosa]